MSFLPPPHTSLRERTTLTHLTHPNGAATPYQPSSSPNAPYLLEPFPPFYPQSTTTTDQHAFPAAPPPSTKFFTPHAASDMTDPRSSRRALFRDRFGARCRYRHQYGPGGGLQAGCDYEGGYEQRRGYRHEAEYGGWERDERGWAGAVTEGSVMVGLLGFAMLMCLVWYVDETRLLRIEV